jgi:hypothetical protein
MITGIFCAAVIWLAWKIIKLGLRLTWGIVKMACSVLFLPALLLGLVYVGLMYVAIPVLVLAGILVLIGLAKSS